MLKVKGRWVAKEAIPENLKLRFFSNQPLDYETNKSIFEQDLIFKKTDIGYGFRVSQIMLNRWRGLYYYVIEERESREKYVVGKVEVL